MAKHKAPKIGTAKQQQPDPLTLRRFVAVRVRSAEGRPIPGSEYLDTSTLHPDAGGALGIAAASDARPEEYKKIRRGEEQAFLRVEEVELRVVQRPRCSVCGLPFTKLSGEVLGCAVHGIRAGRR